MRGQECDLTLLFDRDNVRYFTGFRLNRACMSILAVSSGGEPTYAVARLDIERARRDCWIERIVAFPEDTPSYLAALDPFLTRGVRRIGVERDVLTLAHAEAIREQAEHDVEFVDIRAVTTRLRLIKCEEEVRLLRAAASVADQAMDAVREVIRSGQTEADIVGFVEHQVRLAGGEGTSFEPFMMSGERAWLPQRVGSNHRMRDGEMAILDMGAVVDGYSSDLTRTFGLGRLTAAQEEVFRLSLEAHDAAIEAVRPGVLASDVDAAARDMIAATGHGEHFPHITGHGLGVSTHEPPIIDEGVSVALQPGMVLTIEPGVYVPGVGAARIEDMVLVTNDGHEVLTQADRGLSRKGQL